MGGGGVAVKEAEGVTDTGKQEEEQQAVGHTDWAYPTADGDL